MNLGARVFPAAGAVTKACGWATSPYEYEVGMADLTIGILGISGLKFREDFWLATAIADRMG
jgi:hypothetical protein